MGLDVDSEAAPNEVIAKIANTSPDAVLLDLQFPGDARTGTSTGARLLTEIRQRFPLIPVVVFTVRLSDFDIPLETFEVRPHGYFAKPDFAQDEDWAEQLANTIRDAIAVARPEQTVDAANLGFLVGKSSEMHAAVAAARRAAENQLPVLIFGETGTGKRHVAKAIHELSNRTGQFERYHCAGAGGATAVEALFGREDGGAGRAQPGLIELADGGAFFLDGIDRLHVDLQDGVMRAVEDGVVRRIGGVSDVPVDVRWIAGTSHGLDDLVADGALRDDLAFRFAGGIAISLPPLRQRMVDLPDLYASIVGKAAKANGRRILTTLRPETQEKLEAHRWPGNILELETVLARAVVTCNSNVLMPDDIELIPSRSSGSKGGVAGKEPIVPETAIPALVTELEGLPIERRYGFIMDLGAKQRREVLLGVIRKLRTEKGKPIQHKVLAAELDPLVQPETDLNRIRQCLHNSRIKLTKLEFNQ